MEGLTNYQTILVWIVILLLSWATLMLAKLNKTLDDIYDLFKSKKEKEDQNS